MENNRAVDFEQGVHAFAQDIKHLWEPRELVAYNTHRDDHSVEISIQSTYREPVVTLLSHIISLAEKFDGEFLLDGNSGGISEKNTALISIQPSDEFESLFVATLVCQFT